MSLPMCNQGYSWSSVLLLGLIKHTSNPLMEQLVHWASIWQVVITSCPGKQRGPARLAAKPAASLAMGIIHPGVSVNMCVDACFCAHVCVCVCGEHYLQTAVWPCAATVC